MKQRSAYRCRACFVAREAFGNALYRVCNRIFGGWQQRLPPRQSRAANDMELAAGLGHSLSELIERLRDGKRCHLDTLALAELFRAVIPQMAAVIDEADVLRGIKA